MPKTKFDVKQFDVKLYEKILRRGLSNGVGDRWPKNKYGQRTGATGPGKGRMCIEAAICATLGYDEEDNPKCVTQRIANFKIGLNDCGWSTPKARAKGLHDLGLAQLGSRGVITDTQFRKAFAKEAQKELFPAIEDATGEVLTSHNKAHFTDYLPIPTPRGKDHDKFLLMTAEVALTVLKKLKSPGVRLLAKKGKK